MNYNIIQSGSKGNCTIIENKIAIDMGVSFEKLKPYYKNLKAVFISHEHGDHLNHSTIKLLAFLKPSLKFIVGNYLAQELVNLGVEKRNIIIIDLDKWYDFNLFKCKLEYIAHDVPNVAIHLELNNEKLLYATDTSSLDGIEAKDYNYYLIEGNYKEQELEQRKQEKMAKGEFVIEDRIANSHLSYEKCLEYFNKNANDKSILEVMHKHLERENNESNN